MPSIGPTFASAQILHCGALATHKHFVAIRAQLSIETDETDLADTARVVERNSGFLVVDKPEEAGEHDPCS
jgi:hypothetical protein